jgi:hypothetical protein
MLGSPEAAIFVGLGLGVLIWGLASGIQEKDHGVGLPAANIGRVGPSPIRNLQRGFPRCGDGATAKRCIRAFGFRRKAQRIAVRPV